MAGPLQGVRIVEMGQLIAIPSAMKWLADMGAEVIRLESVQRLESYRTDSLYHNMSKANSGTAARISMSKTATSRE